MALLRPPAGLARGGADARRRDPSPLPAAGAGALRGSPSGAALSNRDQVWEVLHQRERSLEDVRQSPKQPIDRPSSPARYFSQPPAQGWNVPQAGALEWRYEPKLPAIPRNLRYMEHEQSPASHIDMTGWLERRLEGVQSECKAEIASRLGAQEQKDRHFKDWVQREHEQLSSSLKQFKTSVDAQLKSSLDSQAQGARQGTALQAQCQKLEMRLHEMEVGFAQTTAQVQGLSQSLQAIGGASGGGGGTGGTGASPQQAAVDALRMGLEREVAARTELSIEAKEKIKELHHLLAEANDRYQREVQSRVLQQSAGSDLHEARLATRAPLESVRGELDALQENLRRTAADCSRRCEEAEAACARRASNVQEAAMSAAKELWEEHVGIVQECKASLASLQQILEAKDKILSQLQQLQQQQRADDKQENANRHQQVIDAVRNRLRDVEVAFTSERSLRAEVQQATDAHIGRVGSAVEKAHAEWVKDAERLSEAVKDIRQQIGASLDGEAKGWERRLAEAIDGVTRRLEELENRVATADATSTGLDAKLTELSRTQEVGVKELEARLKRDLSDFDTMQTGKLSQTNFDLRNAVKKALSASSEQTRVELARIEESAALERSVLRAAIQDNAQHADTQVGRLQEDIREAMTALHQDLDTRCNELAGGLQAIGRDMTVRDDAVQAHAVRLSSDVLAKCTDSLDKMQKQTEAHALETDIRIADLQRALTKARDEISDKIDEVQAGAQAQLIAELEKLQEDIQMEVHQLVDEERRARTKADMERVASLQRKLGAIEHTVSRLMDQLREEQEEQLVAHQQSVQAELTRDREEVRSRLEEIQREQTEAARAAKAELERLNVACETFAAECGEAIDRTAANSAKALEAASEQARLDLARVEASAALERSVLKSAIQDSVQHTNAEVGRVEDEMQQLMNGMRQDLEKRCSELDAQMSKRDDEVRTHAEALSNDVLTKMDTRCTHLQRALTTARDNLLEKINEAKTGLEAEMEKRHSDMQQEVHQLVDEERQARELVEENTAKSMDQLRTDQEESLAAHRQSVQAELTKDRVEMQSKLEELQRVQTEAAAHVKSELERLNTACETFAAECGEAIDRTAANSAKALQESAEHARLELARVEETATLERGALRTEMHEKAQRTDSQVLKLRDDVSAMRQDLDKRCGEMADGLKEMGKDISVRDDEVKAHAERLVTDLLNKTEARGAELEEAMKTAQDSITAKIEEVQTGLKAHVAGELDKRQGDIEKDVQRLLEEERQTRTKAVEASSEQARVDLRRVEYTATQERNSLRAAVEENVQNTTTQVGKLQEELQQLATTTSMTRQDVEKRCGELADGLKEIGKDIAQRDDEVQAHAERLVADLSNKTDARCADLEQALKATQENLTGKIGEVQTGFQAQVTGELDKRHSDMQQEVRRLVDEEKQARTQAVDTFQGEITHRMEAQEAVQSSSQSAVQAQLMELTRQQRKREDDGAAEMQAQLKTLSDEQDTKLQAEVTRASTAEDALRKQLEEKAKAEEELQKKLDEIGGTQDKMKSEVSDLKAFKDKSDEAEAAAVAAAEESSAASKKAAEEQENARGKLEEELRDIVAKQCALQKDVEGFKGTQEAQLKSLREEQEVSLLSEVKRASAVEEELKKQIEAGAKAEQDHAAALQSETTRASTAEEQLRKQMEERAKADQDVQKKLEELGSTQAQLKTLRDEQDTKLQSEVTRASTAEDALRKQLEDKAKAEEELQKKLDEIGGTQDKMRSEVSDLKAFKDKSAEAEAAAVAAQEENSAASKKALEEQESARGKLEEELRAVVTKQTALQEDVVGLKASQEAHQENVEGQKKLEERLAVMEQKQGESMDAQTQAQNEVAEKVVSVNKDVEALSAALGNRDEAFVKLHSRVDGGFAAMNVKLETERWFRVQMDAAADTIGNDFLRILDQKTNHLEKRVEQIEEKVKD